MKYTKQHFEEIAYILKEAKNQDYEEDHNPYEAILYIQDKLEQMFLLDNPRFDIERFRKASMP